VEHQARLISDKLDAGQPLEQVLQVIAPPGCSEHHTGKAVDLGTREAQPLDPEFESTPAFAWLKDHAARFGFRLSFPPNNVYGYVYEPWHWCFEMVPEEDDGRL
jgi:D-alanyl-D-alanine carboxypeptidase